MNKVFKLIFKGFFCHNLPFITLQSEFINFKNLDKKNQNSGISGEPFKHSLKNNPVKRQNSVPV